jgi:hypothetical protein
LPINMVIVIRKKSTKRRKTEGRKARSIRPWQICLSRAFQSIPE